MRRLLCKWLVTNLYDHTIDMMTKMFPISSNHNETNVKYIFWSFKALCTDLKSFKAIPFRNYAHSSVSVFCAFELNISVA